MLTFRQFLSLTLLSSSLALVGCGSTEPAETTPAAKATPAPAAPASNSDPYAVCVATFERQRACTDTYIPALVEARVQADHPAGIAAADQKDGRDALVAAALEEWKQDSTDESIAATCKKLVASAPAEMVEAAEGCLAESECGPFSTCAVDLVKAHWR
jgi:predicted small lipoprotein YifL